MRRRTLPMQRRSKPPHSRARANFWKARARCDKASEPSRGNPVLFLRRSSRRRCAHGRRDERSDRSRSPLVPRGGKTRRPSTRPSNVSIAPSGQASASDADESARHGGARGARFKFALDAGHRAGEVLARRPICRIDAGRVVERRRRKAQKCRRARQPAARAAAGPSAPRWRGRSTVSSGSARPSAAAPTSFKPTRLSSSFELGSLPVLWVARRGGRLGGRARVRSGLRRSTDDDLIALAGNERPSRSRPLRTRNWSSALRQEATSARPAFGGVAGRRPR